jgi:hypothetical protein
MVSPALQRRRQIPKHLHAFRPPLMFLAANRMIIPQVRLITGKRLD